MSTHAKISGRGVAYFGMALGLIMSITANVTSALLSEGQLWVFLRVPVAALWPVWVWVALEVLIRIEWRSHWTHWIVRAILVGPTGTVAAIVSFLHARHLLRLAGEPEIVQALGPLAIDGTLFGCAVALRLITIKARDLKVTSGPSLAERVAAMRTQIQEVRAAALTGVAPTPELTQTPEATQTPEVTPDPEPKVVPSPRRANVVPLRGSWDVRKAVGMIREGQSDGDVGAAVGVGPKSIQRLRRAVAIVGAEGPNAEIPATLKVPAAVAEILRDEARRW